MNLKDNLKRIRKENNLSQEQLAEKLGVSRQAVSKWESGQSYPEMDKVLMICKMFNYNMDELMNENIKETEEIKQSKININKYIDDFFSYITKTVGMLSSMKFMQIVKCVIEQIVVILVLFFIAMIIGGLGNLTISGIMSVLPKNIHYTIYNILKSGYIILALTVGTAVFLHIFKIRYLDYYEIVDQDSTEKTEDKNNDTQDENKKNRFFEKKSKEKIIIRDPEQSQFKFLNGIIKMVLLCIKFIAICIVVGFMFSFITLITLLVVSFLFVKTGLVFWGGLLALISALIINFILLELFYNFIVSRKSKKSRMAIMLLISLVLAGIGIGIILIGLTNFNYIDNPDGADILEEKTSYSMSPNLTISDNYGSIQFVETDTEEIQILVKHSNLYSVNISDSNEKIKVHIRHEDGNFIENLRKAIKDINNKEIRNYDFISTSVYTSKDNIKKLIENEKKNMK